MPKFAIYLHPQVTALSKPAEQIAFTGFSWPYWQQVRRELAGLLKQYPSLPLRKPHRARKLRLVPVHHPL